MIRWLTVGAGMLASAALSFAYPDVGGATPSDEPGGGHCTWTPVSPTLERVSDINMVTAQLKRGPCTLIGNPSGETVCLSIQSEDSAGECKTSYSDPAKVYYKYVPGATYVVTGRGCVNILEAPYTMCQTFGPSYYTM